MLYVIHFSSPSVPGWTKCLPASQATCQLPFAAPAGWGASPLTAALPSCRRFGLRQLPAWHLQQQDGQHVENRLRQLPCGNLPAVRRSVATRFFAAVIHYWTAHLWPLSLWGGAA